MLHKFRTIVSEKGFWIYKGLNIRLIYAIPASFISFSTLEMSKSLLKKFKKIMIENKIL